MERLSIGKLARAANVSADTVRYYERMGLISPPKRASSGYRSYMAADVSRLLMIRRARAMGFSIEEIAELMALRAGSESARARSLIDSKLAGIDEKLAELRCWRTALAELRTLSSGTSLEALLTAHLEDGPARPPSKTTSGG